MLTIDKYKELVGPDLISLSDVEIRRTYDFDVTIASFALKSWLASRRGADSRCDTIAPPCQESRSQ